MSLLRRLLDDERIRYLGVGAWNTLFGYLLFLLLLELLGGPIQTFESSSFAPLAWLGREYYVVVGWVGWVFSVAQSTATMKYFVFRKGGSFWRQTFRAYFVYLPSQFIGSGLLWFMVRVVGLHPRLGALATTAITVVFSYLGHKYFTFKVPLEVGEVTPLIMEDDDSDAGSGAAGAGRTAGSSEGSGQ